MSLKTAFGSRFKIGAAISRKNLNTKQRTDLLLKEFNSFTCENDMKPMFFLDEEENLKDPSKYNLAPKLRFDIAAPYLEFAKKNGIAMRGHTLVWHNQTPKWFFHEDYDVSKPFAERDIMLSRLENYIKGVLTYIQEEFPGIIYAWDVVNEIIDEGDYRRSLWTQVVGEDFFIKAFEYARKYADKNVSLFYNDYNTFEEEKRDLILEKVLKPLMNKSLVDGMGMQSHLVLGEHDLDLYSKALDIYGKTGLEVQITELDIHIADNSDEAMDRLSDMYEKLFKILVSAKDDNRADITSVTFWNLQDEDSWLTSFRKETSYPLLFHKESECKKAYFSVIETA